MAARDEWLEEAEIKSELQRRPKSDFLCYCNHDGLFAHFHSKRHVFIAGLERAGVSPRMAQTLARHSDIRLTLGATLTWNCTTRRRRSGRCRGRR